jgi:cytochrome c55X
MRLRRCRATLAAATRSRAFPARVRAGVAAAAWLVAVGAAPARADPASARVVPDPARQVALIELLRQDCGSCHGMRLTGGLGPPLTAEALRERPAASIAATIVHGRPGTAMPPWRRFVDEDEAWWLAGVLRSGNADSHAR